jgi:hypothetical protein
LQRHINAGREVGIELTAVLLVLFETAGLDFDRVKARRQLRDDEVTFGVRCGATLKGPGVALDRDLGAGDDAAGLVLNEPGDLRVVRLREARNRNCERQCRQQSQFEGFRDHSSHSGTHCDPSLCERGEGGDLFRRLHFTIAAKGGQSENLVYPFAASVSQ